jgi:hypothetical protein
MLSPSALCFLSDNIDLKAIVKNKKAKRCFLAAIHGTRFKKTGWNEKRIKATEFNNLFVINLLNRNCTFSKIKHQIIKFVK